jgi:hypothetical protein
MLQVDVQSYLPGTEGMLGPGIFSHDGRTVVSDANEMGTQWQVRNTEPMLFQDSRAPQYPETCLMPSVTSRRNLC